jgi:hypothetical protein
MYIIGTIGESDMSAPSEHHRNWLQARTMEASDTLLYASAHQGN